MTVACGLQRAALFAVEREVGAQAQCWSHVLAAMDPRYANLFVLGDTSVLIVPGRRVGAEHLDLVAEPGDHYGSVDKKIIYAHSWAEIAPEAEADEGVSIRRIDDATCAQPPLTDAEPNTIGRGVLGCFAMAALLVAAPYAAHELWAMSPWVSVPVAFLVLTAVPLAWRAVR